MTGLIENLTLNVAFFDLSQKYSKGLFGSLQKIRNKQKRLDET